MEAKDTVMKERGVDYDANCGQMIACDILPKYIDATKDIEACYIEISVAIDEFVESERKAQAEISFKMGYNQGVEDFTECAKYIEKGRREVVEWVAREFGVDWSQEKEQLKEWNIGER